VFCWGYDVISPRKSRRGAPDFAQSPARMPDLERALDIAPFAWGICAVMSEGRVRCRGEIEHWLDGKHTPVPLTVRDFDVPGATTIAGSGTRVCASGSSGALCWGWEPQGSAGERRFPEPTRALEGPTQAIAVGHSHSCIVRPNGEVECWGDGFYGQAGPDRSNAPSLRRFEALDGAIALAAGVEHTCAVTEEGRVACAGGNHACERGQRRIASNAAVTEVPGVEGAVAIAAGARFTCALLATRRVACWGWNQECELGNGTCDERGMRAASGTDCSPTTVVDLDDATAIAAGGSHACATRANGDVACWGSNRGGELGVVGPQVSPRPVTVRGLP
jgi:hypothetical protein